MQIDNRPRAGGNAKAIKTGGSGVAEHSKIDWPKIARKPRKSLSPPPFAANSERIRRIRAPGKPLLTQARLTELATYDPMTGHFLAAQARGGLRVGDCRGTTRVDGYIAVIVDYWSYLAHRLAFLAMTGEFPPDHLQVDHINHRRNDNRWANLRAVPGGVNRAHRSPATISASGHRGVRARSSGNFSAAIEVDGTLYHLGTYECRSDAIAARCEAERHHFGDFAAQLAKATGGAT